MRRLVRRNLVRDAAGRPLWMDSERVTEDADGSLQQTSEHTARFCSGCRRPVADLSELRGVCDWCHARGCCVQCLSQCQVCSRRLCGQCRRGFAGPPGLTVCTACQDRLIQRQLVQDQQVQFERELARHRLHQQDQALRFDYERTFLMARLQAARMGLNLTIPHPESWLQKFLRQIRRFSTAVMRHVFTGLRQHPARRGVRPHR